MDGHRSASIAGVVCLLAASTAASGQNALGDGRRLDRNPLRGSGGANAPTRDLAAEVRFRNAIVTGNAPGGLSFRGDAGYRAPGEFMAPLGSNNLFNFRRDSVYSGLAGLGIRGTDALQYQFALTTGNAPPQGFTGSGIVSRSGGADATGAVPPAGRTPGTRPDQPVAVIAPGQPGADRRGTEMWLLRSPSAFVSTRSIEPSLMAVLPGGQAGEEVGVTASGLRGLASAPMKRDEPFEPAPGSSERIDLGAGAIVSGAPKEGADAQAEAARRTGYHDLLDRMAARGISLPEGPPAAPGEESVPAWRRRLNELQRQLEGAGKADARRATPPTGTDGAPTTTPRDTVDLLRDAGGKITRLAPSGFDAYAVHMQRGQKYLAEGQYFFAEERFTAALGVRPDDPMASIGRVHAQLGAGLFSSAATNLRLVLVKHPEMAGARYGEGAFPDAGRSARIIQRLDGLVASGGGLGADTGLLLAYVGYQTGDPGATTRGLTAMEGRGGAPDPQLLQLARLLREVWANPVPEK